MMRSVFRFAAVISKKINTKASSICIIDVVITAFVILRLFRCEDNEQ
jgi:hypothetical protein